MYISFEKNEIRLIKCRPCGTSCGGNRINAGCGNK
jgi:hypothetical protein